MRTVRFDLKDRMVLAPVEIRNYRWWMLLLLLSAIFVPFYGPLALTLTLAGIFLFPALLPFLPGKELSLKGMAWGRWWSRHSCCTSCSYGPGGL